MNNTISTTAILLLSSLGALAQGYVNFSTRVTGAIVAHVYAESQDFAQTGNSPSETPAGTTIYTGPRLTGSGFSANLWSANGPGQPESALVLVPGSLTSFRTGANLGGTPAPHALAVPNVPPDGTGTFHIRVWDNEGGVYASWETARYRGKSVVFEVASLADGSLPLPANMYNVRSFSFYDPLFVPEPGTYVLFGLGALGLWLFRRKQPVA